MSEHFTRAEISELLDDSGARPDVMAHLTQCESCRHEFEQLSRMHMVLSAMPELEPPAGQWERIEARLATPLVGGAADPSRLRWLSPRRWPLQAAAVVALFAGGLVVGSLKSSSGMFPGPQRGEITSTLPGTASSSTAPVPTPAETEYLRTVAELTGLRTAWMAAPRDPDNPAWMAEQMTRLDALAEAAREALRRSPADPMLNNFLFQVEDDRKSMASRLDETLRLTTLEYR